MQFEFYVLNFNAVTQKVEMFNLFRNRLVNEAVEKEVKAYVKQQENYKPKLQESYDKSTGFAALVYEIEKIIMWQEWSRREYEIYVADAFETDIAKCEKWDCYRQAQANIKAIARECVYQYKKHYKLNS